ncbi:hypothetical protein [Halomicronema sp. CCY15110]|uniref:hypothetical protein n=1 Tax=Halomicronema sp. CCY15110 TaxID=2767773 RepID=UPI00194F9AB2|nr:hypothetical protein [Halomicronema sp. CCY15110]
MSNLNDYTFCTLALGHRYCLLAKQMSENLNQTAPGHQLVVLTDNPEMFADCNNVVPVFFKQQGALHCYHDKRFAIEQALKHSDTAVMVDVDAGFENVISDLRFEPGIECYSENLIEHVTKWTPERLTTLHKVAEKVDVEIDHATWIGESLFAVTKDDGKEQAFLQYWGQIGRYLELNKIHAGSGNAIGLAAAKVGWVPRKSDAFIHLKSLWNHFDASLQRPAPTLMSRLRRKFTFHYRLNLQRIKALKDFEFYYR